MVCICNLSFKLHISSRNFSISFDVPSITAIFDFANLFTSSFADSNFDINSSFSDSNFLTSSLCV